MSEREETELRDTETESALAKETEGREESSVRSVMRYTKTTTRRGKRGRLGERGKGDGRRKRRRRTANGRADS